MVFVVTPKRCEIKSTSNVLRLKQKKRNTLAKGISFSCRFQLAAATSFGDTQSKERSLLRAHRLRQDRVVRALGIYFISVVITRLIRPRPQRAHTDHRSVKTECYRKAIDTEKQSMAAKAAACECMQLRVQSRPRWLSGPWAAAAMRIALVFSTLASAPSSATVSSARSPSGRYQTCRSKIASGAVTMAPPLSGRRTLVKRLQLRGGSGESADLVIPDSFEKLETVLTVLAADETATEASVVFRAGNHSIGTEQCNNMAVVLDRDNLRLRVRGEAGTTLAGAWRCAGGGGEVQHARLLDVALLANCNYDGEFLHPGIMYGDCCITVSGSCPWAFRDCEVQCSGTALRAFDDADVMCERLVIGGSADSQLPPSNIFDMQMPPWLKQLLLESLDTRNKTTGLPLYPDSSMPRYGITAWGRARVKLNEVTIINMTYNGVGASENATMEIHGCSISGSGMAGVYLEG